MQEDREQEWLDVLIHIQNCVLIVMIEIWLGSS